MKQIRVLLIAPSLDIVGGQSVQAARLLEAMGREAEVQVDSTNQSTPAGTLAGLATHQVREDRRH